jgi:hypothetical protein
MVGGRPAHLPGSGLAYAELAHAARAVQAEAYAQRERSVRSVLSDRFRSLQDTGASLDMKVSGGCSAWPAFFPSFLSFLSAGLLP